MARAGTRQRGSRAVDAQRALIAATIASLRDVGYAGSSAREIASRAGVSQASVFYHFGSMDELLLAALDETSSQRMRAYGEAMRSVTSMGELFDVAGRVFADDLDDGHLKVLSELIAACSGAPELGARVATRIDPWIDLTEATISRVVGATPVAQLVDLRDLATAVVSLYLGLELITHLQGHRRAADMLFRTARDLVGVFDALVSQSTPSKSSLKRGPA